MKKNLLILVSLFLGMSVYATAQEPVKQETVAAQPADDGFKEVKLADLSEKVQTAVNAYADTHTVKTLASHAEKKHTKVTLTPKDGSSEKVVVLNEEGAEVNS